jgi:hypothetical protein
MCRLTIITHATTHPPPPLLLPLPLASPPAAGRFLGPPLLRIRRTIMSNNSVMLVRVLALMPPRPVRSRREHAT